MGGMLGDITVTLLFGSFAAFFAVFLPIMLLFSQLDDFPPKWTPKQWFLMASLEFVALSIVLGLYMYWHHIILEAMQTAG